MAERKMNRSAPERSGPTRSQTPTTTAPARFVPGQGGSTSADEHRGFPRVPVSLRFEVWIPDGDGRRFSAVLDSDNVSVSGAFLKSTFFLPVGTGLRVRFMVRDTEPVEAGIEIVRHESDTRTGRTGLGVRFTEFFGQSEVALARVFLDERLRTFTADYLRSDRAARFTTPEERLVDAIAAWELLKATTAENPWASRLRKG